VTDRTKEGMAQEIKRLKFVIVGQPKCGRTSFIQRFLNDSFGITTSSGTSLSSSAQYERNNVKETNN
jgi:GTPase SAR1 family protein